MIFWKVWNTHLGCIQTSQSPLCKAHKAAWLCQYLTLKNISLPFLLCSLHDSCWFLKKEYKITQTWMIDLILYLTKFIKGDIGHVTNVPLVLLDGLRLGNDRVGHVTVGAPADEGFPVIVHFAAVHMLTILFTVFQNHFHKHCKTDSTIVRL